ncbi:MAG: hypothetical protein IJY09_09210 [Lachnospiraceae bacterium]|nr:hypothetical protein [Lachnospiraceae bacterium]
MSKKVRVEEVKRKGSCFALSTATRALMIGVSVIIVCIVCSLALYMSKQGKTAINSGTNQYNKMLEEYQDLGLAMYDGLEVSGAEVGSLITKSVLQKEYVSVRVKTKASDFVCYNYWYAEETKSISNQEGENFLTEITAEKGADHYINPQADFFGKVIRNANGTIVCVEFVQQ